MVPSLQTAGPGVPSKHSTGYGSAVLVDSGCVAGAVGVTDMVESGNGSGASSDGDERGPVIDGSTDPEVEGDSTGSTGAEQLANVRTPLKTRTTQASRIRIFASLPSHVVQFPQRKRR